MTNRLEISWKLDGFVDEQRYYCSETPTDVSNLPAPKAIFVGDARTYIDTDITTDKTYFIRLGSVRNNIEKVSEEFSVSTEKGDEFWGSVNLLLQANAASYPTAAIVDSSSNQRAVTVSGAVQIINTSYPKYNEGVIYSNGSASNKILANIEAIGAREFTLEGWVKSNAANSGDNALLFGIWSDESYLNGCALLRDSTTNPARLRLAVSTEASGSGIGYAIPSSAETVLTNGEWVHVCVIRAAGTWNMYLNGVKVGIGAFNASANIGLTSFLALRSPMSGGVFACELNDVRLTNAVRYNVAGFTPPIKQFPNS